MRLDMIWSGAVALSCSQVKVSGWWYLFGRWPFSSQQPLPSEPDEMRFAVTWPACEAQALRLLMSNPLAYKPANTHSTPQWDACCVSVEKRYKVTVYNSLSYHMEAKTHIYIKKTLYVNHSHTNHSFTGRTWEKGEICSFNCMLLDINICYQTM